MENDNNFYEEEYQYYDNDNDYGSDGGVVDNNFTCEPVNISDTRSNNSLASSSNSLSSSFRRPSKKRITHSFVWKHFEKVKDSNGYEFVICKAKKIVNNNEIIYNKNSNNI